MRGSRQRGPLFHEFDPYPYPSLPAQPARRLFRVARLDALCRQPADVHLRGQRGRDGAAAEPLIQQLHRPVRSVLVRGVRQVLDLACLQQLVVPADHGFPGGVDHRLPDPQRAKMLRDARSFREHVRASSLRVPAPRRKPGTHRRAEHGDGPEDAPGTFRLRGARAPDGDGVLLAAKKGSANRLGMCSLTRPWSSSASAGCSTANCRCGCRSCSVARSPSSRTC